MALPEIDLRSDTVTKPDDEMRKAMFDAPLGDDVLDHDPTMAQLEETVADVLGFEAALWVPSGSMGNVIALMMHLDRGDQFLAPEFAHVLGSELGTAAWLAQGMPRALPHDGGPGRPSVDTVRREGAAGGPYFALRTTLLCLENTHNFAGGTVTEPNDWAALVAAAKANDLLVHLDGARLWNAAVALDVAPSELTRGADTVTVCMSKGLGAPVGSVLASDAPRIDEARRIRKMLGGGIRQGGMLAAAGLVALGSMDRLAEDHRNARALADGLRNLGWTVTDPDTNIVLAESPDPSATVNDLATKGIGAVSVAGKVRFVTHRDVNRTDIERALRACAEA
ncbi:threonine aldolase family protein [Actinomycetes bacterium M1A6_2h]